MSGWAGWTFTTGHSVFEIDSDAFHESTTDKAADRRRDDALKAAGIRDVVRINEKVVWRQPRKTLWTVQDARRRAEVALAAEASTDSHALAWESVLTSGRRPG